MAAAGDSVVGNLATALAFFAKGCGDPSIRFQVLFYPVTNASLYTIVHGVLHDEREVYGLKLLEAGVRVTDVRYRTIHDFGMVNVVTGDPAPRGEVEQAFQRLKLVLSA